MSGFGSPKSLGVSSSVQRSHLVPAHDTCGWCSVPADVPIENHDDLCDRKIIEQLKNKGKNKKLKQNSLHSLEYKVKTLIAQVSDYENVLKMIANPNKEVFPKDREACRFAAKQIMQAHSVSV